MGSPDPRAYSRNKRGIAGTLIWINFDRHALLNLFYQARGKFVADVDEIRPQYQDPDNTTLSSLFNSSVVREAGPLVSATIDQLDQFNNSTGWTDLATPWFSDQILPFDITLGAANEYGAMAAAKIFGVEILNEATGVSIDDSGTQTPSFVARTIEPYRLRPSLDFRHLPPSQSTPATTAITPITHVFSAICHFVIAAMPLHPAMQPAPGAPASLPPSQFTPAQGAYLPVLSLQSISHFNACGIRRSSPLFAES
jgi:hypothetical protein